MSDLDFFYDENLLYQIEFDDCQERLEDLYKEKELRKQGKHFDEEWLTSDNSMIEFKDMTDSHLNNAISYFERKLEKLREM